MWGEWQVTDYSENQCRRFTGYHLCFDLLEGTVFMFSEG